MKGWGVPAQRGLNFQYHIRGSGITTHWSIVRNNKCKAAVANIAGQPQSSGEQYQLATRAVPKTLTARKEDYEYLLSSPSIESSPPTETVFKEYCLVNNLTQAIDA